MLAHSHVYDFRSKKSLNYLCDVCTCGTFSGVRSHFSTLLCTFCDKNGHKLLKIATFSSWLMSIHTYLILSYKKTIRWIYSFPRGSRSEKKVGTSRIEGRGIPHAIPSCSALGSLSLYFFTFCKIFFILDIFLKGIKDDVYAQCIL